MSVVSSRASQPVRRTMKRQSVRLAHAARRMVVSAFAPAISNRSTNIEIAAVAAAATGDRRASFTRKEARRFIVELATRLSAALPGGLQIDHIVEGVNVKSADFLRTRAWRQLRYKVLRKFGARCQCCGLTAAQGAEIHVDHIRPRSKYPELALTADNLQVLCADCNIGKSNVDQTDWRPLEA